MCCCYSTVNCCHLAGACMPSLKRSVSGHSHYEMPVVFCVFFADDTVPMSLLHEVTPGLTPFDICDVDSGLGAFQTSGTSERWEVPMCLPGCAVCMHVCVCTRARVCVCGRERDCAHALRGCEASKHDALVHERPGTCELHRISVGCKGLRERH